ncbi:MAG TPA: MDR family MFS transporter, partial [Gaiellaceae bacterium]|nr:MDR family MFS transporter [Gaiellaceae bacterium]
ETPPGYTLPRGRILAIYGGLSIALLLASIDQTIVSTVLPEIVADIGGIGQYSWTFTAYLLTATVTIPLYGKLGDVYGRRPLFVFAIGTFIVSSVLCGFSQTMPELVVSRGLQGVGAGALFPLALATVGEIVPIRERGRYQGLLGAGYAGGAILGPLAGGFIADNASWRWVFLINVPLGAASLVLVLVTMPPGSARQVRQVDYAGAGLLAAATTCLLLGLEWGGQEFAWGSPEVLGAIAGFVVLSGVLVAVETRAREPILPFHLVRQGTVAASLLAIALASMAMYGVMSYAPLFVAAVIGASATSSGAVLMPLLLGDIAASFLTGQWIARSGRMRPNALTGPLVLTTGAILLWRMTMATSSIRAALDMLVAGIGIGLMMQVFTMSVQNAVARADIGAATALNQTCRALGATLGVAVMGVIVNQHLPPSVQASFSTGGSVGHLPHTVRITLEHALHPAFLLAAGAAALLFFVVLVGVHDVPLRSSVDEQPSPRISG